MIQMIQLAKMRNGVELIQGGGCGSGSSSGGSARIRQSGLQMCTELHERVFGRCQNGIDRKVVVGALFDR